MAQIHIGSDLNRQEIRRIRGRARRAKLLGFACLLLYIPLFLAREPIMAWLSGVPDWAKAVADTIPQPEFHFELWTIGEGMLGALLTIAAFVPSLFIQLFVSGIPVALYMAACLFLLLVAPLGLMLLAALSPFLAAGLAWAFASPDENHLRVLEAGVQGEADALGWAKALPADSHVFANLFIEHAGRRSETDLIALTRRGVAVIEVKNYTGVLRGDVSDERLRRYRRSGGELVEKEDCYNPARQVRTHVHNLAGYLRAHGANAWVEGYVLFTNGQLELELTDRYRSDTGVYAWPQRDDLARRLSRPEEEPLTDAQMRRIEALLEAARKAAK